MAYVRDGSAVRAIEGGVELWRTGSTYETSPRVAVDDGRVFVRAGTGLLQFDPVDGSRHWSVDVDHLVYVGTDEGVFAFDSE